MKKKYSLSLIVITLLILILTYGCKNNPIIVSDEPAIFAEVSRFKDSDDSVRTFARVSIDGSPGVPDVTINNDTISSGFYPFQGEVRNYLFSGFISNDPEEKYELVVSHDSGEARAQVTMPSSFEITTPQENDTFNIEEDLIINWDPSDSAERYILDVHLEYLNSNIDSADLSDWIFFNSLVNTTSTSLTIPNESIFPSGSDSVKCGSGAIMIKSENGPSVRLTLDTSGRNISGNGVGYFVAANYTHYFDDYPHDNYLHIIIKKDSTLVFIANGYPEFYDLGESSNDYYDSRAYFDSRLSILRRYDPEFMKFWESSELPWYPF